MYNSFIPENTKQCKDFPIIFSLEIVGYVAAVFPCGISPKNGKEHFNIDFHYSDTDTKQMRVINKGIRVYGQGYIS